MKKILQQYKLEDMYYYYITEETNQTVGLVVLPEALADKFTLEGKWEADSLIQVKALGDVNPIGFSHGHSMRNSGTTQALKYREQKLVQEGACTRIITVLESGSLRGTHTLLHEGGKPYVSIYTEIANMTTDTVTIEMLSSYSLCGFSPIEEAERMEDFQLYRLRSKWSAEGKLDKQSFIDLQLEPSWQRYGVQSVKYGEIGTMPVRKFFPWLVVEDAKYGYCVGSQLYYAGSWQMELYTRDDRAALSGGLADRETGHFTKELAPGMSFAAPKAVVTVSMGDVDEAAHRLVMAQKEGRVAAPESERELPVLFNEFCTTWGNPTEENLLRIVDAIKGKGFGYCVIDAGWYAITKEDWNGDMGDWNINQHRFPGGFEKTVQAIREAGMIPGLWFEMECIGSNAEAFKKEEWQLTRDGLPIQTGLRRFWDMRKPEVAEYLTEKVIGTLQKYNFGYLKVDYNDNIGIGCDGAESLGEGLRQYVEGSQNFFRKLREALPNLVIENCASGGHRLEPSMQAITSMASFSDAHECVTIPVIAANVQRAILPEQSQIWAVLHAQDDDKRLYYSMTSTLLGRMCLSGDIYNLSKGQWHIVEEGIAFYQKAVPIIRDGKSKRYGEDVGSYNHPKGWQAVVRTADDKALVILHKFYARGEENGTVTVCLPEGAWRVSSVYGRESLNVRAEADMLQIDKMEEMEGVAVLLDKYSYGSSSRRGSFCTAE